MVAGEDAMVVREALFVNTRGSGASCRPERVTPAVGNGVTRSCGVYKFTP